MKEPGKKFEEDFKKSCETQGIYVKRLKTRMTPYKNDNEIADFIIYSKPTMFFMETKSTQEKRLAFSIIRPNQALGMEDVSNRFDGILGGFIVQFRLEDGFVHYYVPAKVLMEYVNNDKKSIPISVMESDVRIVKIDATKKRTSVVLDIKKLIESITERK